MCNIYVIFTWTVRELWRKFAYLARDRLMAVAGDLDFFKLVSLSLLVRISLQDSSASLEKLCKQAMEAISLMFSMQGLYLKL